LGHRWLEGAVAIAQQHGYCAGKVISYDNVQFAVVVDICNHNGSSGVSAGPIAYPRLERPIAIADQHAYASPTYASPSIHFHNVGLAIAVHIRDCHVTGVVSAGIIHGWLDSSVAIAQQHADHSVELVCTALTSALVGYQEVRLAIAVHIGDRYRLSLSPTRVADPATRDAGRSTRREGAIAMARQPGHSSVACKLYAARADAKV
jgi:hypothetical protein